MPILILLMKIHWKNSVVTKSQRFRQVPRYLPKGVRRSLHSAQVLNKKLRLIYSTDYVKSATECYSVTSDSPRL